MNKQKLDMCDIVNIAWTIYRFYPGECPDDCSPNEYMYDCARAALIAQQTYGDCMPVEDFLDAVEVGGFTAYDGDGYFCDKDGNDLGDVWSTKTVPVDTKFVMWFNK